MQWLGETGKVCFVDSSLGASLALQIGFAARFDAENAEVLTERHFVDSDANPFQDSVRPVKAHHLQKFGVFLLPSHRTCDRVLSFSSGLFRRALKVGDAKPSAVLLELRDYLRTPEACLEKTDEFGKVIERVQQELANYVGAK